MSDIRIDLLESISAGSDRFNTHIQRGNIVLDKLGYASLAQLPSLFDELREVLALLGEDMEAQSRLYLRALDVFVPDISEHERNKT